MILTPQLWEEGMDSLFSLPSFWRSRRRRSFVLACCAIGAGGYLSYRIYNSASVTRKRLQLYRLFYSLSSLLDSVAQGSDCVDVLWKDLQSFILSDEDDVPQTLKQLFKVGQTREFQMSVALLCKSVTQGVGSSLSEQGPHLEGGGDYGSAFLKELSSEKGSRKIGKAGYWKVRRSGSGVAADASQPKDIGEGDYDPEYSRRKLKGSKTVSRVVTSEEGATWMREEDEAEVYSWAGPAREETSGSSVIGKRRTSSAVRESTEAREEGLSERLMGKFLSEAGRGFASVVVASATRSLVLSMLEGMRGMRQGDAAETVWSSLGVKDCNVIQPKARGKNGAGEETLNEMASTPASGTFQDVIMDFICSSNGKSLVADCTEIFIGTAVSVYLDKTRDVNVYEEMLTTVSNPAHRESVKEVLTSVCNGALETLIRTAHEVLSVGSVHRQSESVRRLTFSIGNNSCFNSLQHSDMQDSGECRQFERGNDHIAPGSSPPWTPDSHDTESLSFSGLQSKKIAFDQSPRCKPVNDLQDLESSLFSSPSSRQVNGKCFAGSEEGPQGWLDSVSRTLAVPSNRSLVLDVAGTVTAEVVRSTIDVMLSKVSHTLRGMGKNGFVSEMSPGYSKVMHVITKTGEQAQATAAKALVAMTMCLAICLHTLLGQTTVMEHS